MPKNKFCPNCSSPLKHRALVDSDDHIYSSWYECPKCGFDQRKDALAQPASGGEHV